MEPEAQVVYSSLKPCAGINLLLKKHNGDVIAVLKDLFAPPCDIQEAQKIEKAFSKCLGLSERQFMRAFRRIHRAKKITLEELAAIAPSSSPETPLKQDPKT